MAATFTPQPLTSTRSKVANNGDSTVPLIASRFADLTQVASTTFLAVVDSAFYRSQYFTDTPNLPALDFKAMSQLGPGDEQILVLSNDAGDLQANRTHLGSAVFVANGSMVLTVNGNSSLAYGDNSSDIVLGLSNQKIYNGATSFLDGPAFRSYDALITTYEHASVKQIVHHSDTIYHFGELDVLRKGNEDLTIHGETVSQVFGPQETTIHGNSISVTETFAVEKYDSVMTVKSVAGLKIETNVGLGVIALAGTETNINSFAMVVAISESLLSIFDGKIQLIVMDNVAGLFGTEGLAAKAFGACIRGGAAVFGVLRI